MYQNYDFGEHWDTKILPHLQTPQFEKLFRRIKRKSKVAKVNDYLKKDISPVLLSGTCAFCTLTGRLIRYELDHQERMTKKEKRLYKKYQSSAKDDQGSEKCWDVYNELEDSILSRINLNWDTNKDHLAFYIPMGQCFLWNRYFGLWLAKKLYPKENWVVEESEEHCTVVCHKSKRIFDILYWSLDKRLEDYCKYHAGQWGYKKLKYSSKDVSLGGKDAYESTRPQKTLREPSKRKPTLKGVCFCADSYPDSKVGQCDIISQGSVDKCCWCSDKRTEKEKKNPEVYIDNVGCIKPLKYGVKYPRDIGYCPRCKKTKISSAELYNQILSKVRNFCSDSDSE
jgi:hypothetical protein